MKVVKQVFVLGFKFCLHFLWLQCEFENQTHGVWSELAHYFVKERKKKKKERKQEKERKKERKKEKEKERKKDECKKERKKK
jgi:hypothetical protein